MWVRTVSGVVGFVALASVAGCTHDPKPNYSTVSPTGISAATSPSPSPSATSAVVPIDQIPPGNPATWVPAGVPTTAPYQERGDKVPLFTQAMFQDSQTGALAAARYYLDARNWALAMVDPKPFSIVCDAPRCKADGPYFAKIKAAKQHFVGARQTPGAPKLVAAPASSRADWVVQVRLAVAAGRLLDPIGKTMESQAATSDLVNIYVKWNGKMWRISDDALAG
jgi:hypothetical protein